jgi:hypothetical protein
MQPPAVDEGIDQHGPRIIAFGPEFVSDGENNKRKDQTQVD